MQEKIKLSTFLAQLREALLNKFPGIYYVIGEIGDLKINQNGHCYIELVEKDDSRIIARCRANVWASSVNTIFPEFEKNTGEELKEGMKILCHVQVQFHEVYGLSLNIVQIDPGFTLGERARKKKEVLEKLKQERILEMNKSLPFPLVPTKIAVISSEKAAGYQDFKVQLDSNSYGYKIETELFKAVLQGNNASHSIIEALKEIFYALDEKQFDVVAILRGGGSQLDLDCFDSYELSRAVARFPRPVITGIGHDRDQTITDIVAHTELKTPTAVADHILQLYMGFEEEMYRLTSRTGKVISRLLSVREMELNNSVLKFKHLSERVAQSNYNGLEHFKSKLQGLLSKHLAKSQSQLDLLSERIKSADPAYILNRGYTLTSYNGILLRNVADVSKGEEIVSTGKDFVINSTITSIKNRKK